MNAKYEYLRPLKRQCMKKMHENFRREDDLCVQEFNNAIILPLKKFSSDSLLFGRGGVVDCDGNYVVNSGIPNRVEGKYNYAVSKSVTEEVVYCGYLVKHWGHFLIEAVARLWFVIENNLNVGKFIFFVEENSNTQIQGNFREFFELLGIWDKVEIINSPIRYKKVYVPELAYKYDNSYSIHYKRIFDEIIKRVKDKNKKNKTYDKIFLSRSQFKKAQEAEAGLELLDNYFQKNDYKVIYPEKMRLSELIFLIQNAKEIATESGTGAHNVLFGYDGQKIIVVERQTIFNATQANIDCIRDLDVTYIDGHYTIYPVSAGYGPYILTYNQWFEKFSNDNKYFSPDEIFLKKKYLRKCVKQYMKVYKNEYYYTWGLEDWQIKYAEVIYEAYKDSCSELENFLIGREMYRYSQLLEVRHIKNIIKKVLK